MPQLYNHIWVYELLSKGIGQRWVYTEKSLVVIAVLSHIGLAIWACETLWLPLLTIVKKTPAAAVIKPTIFLLIIAIVFITPILVRYFGHANLQESWVPIWMIWKRP
jgi:hypothetical protein